MNQCNSCEGFVPAGITQCPNCRTKGSGWWRVPLALAGAGLATVTLSACYGAPCVTFLPDGGTKTGATTCNYDCRITDLADGGDRTRGDEWQANCVEHPSDGGSDAGSTDDAGMTDGGDGG